MNEQFYDLPQEKQMRIINAGLEVFSKNDYKHAVTDEIARKAGISKGLLFYYFHNKKSLYLYLFDYCAKLIMNQVMGSDREADAEACGKDGEKEAGKQKEGAPATWETITDFFELIEYSAKAKIKVLEKTPYLADFVMRCYYSDDSGIGEEMNRKAIAAVNMTLQEYFKNIDYTKFKPEVSPQEVYEMLTWMTEGFLYNRRKSELSASLDEVMKKFCVWEKWLKQIAYKEEYQDAEPEGGLWENR